jgi:LPPG:FO 2-phospho-L-lactate transferase
VNGFYFQDVEQAKPAPGVIEDIRDADLVVICPSNPWVSVDPILAVPGIRSAVKERLSVAVSPIVGGKAIKGPAAKMYQELGIDPSAYSVGKHYNDIVDGLVIDNLDVGLAGAVKDLGLRPLATDTIMRNRQDRRRLASEVLAFMDQ